jgi:GxxExxY protein
MRREPNKVVEEYAFAVIGAAIEVHRELGPGYLESVYETALSIEFELRNIKYKQQHMISLNYKNKPVGESRLDFLVGDCLIIELKAVEQLIPIHHAQVISYSKATKLHLGLLINFNVLVLKHGIERVILS